MNRTFWRGFLLGSLVFGLLGMWASPRRNESWEDRGRAVVRGATRLMRASSRSAGALGRTAGKVGRSAGKLVRRVAASR